MLYGQIPAALGIEHQFRRADSKPRSIPSAYQMQDIPILFLHILQGNPVNGSPVAALAPSFGVEDGCIQDDGNLVRFFSPGP
jgi:hypothetical protein